MSLVPCVTNANPSLSLLGGGGGGGGGSTVTTQTLITSTISAAGTITDFLIGDPNKAAYSWSVGVDGANNSYQVLSAPSTNTAYLDVRVSDAAPNPSNPVTILRMSANNAQAQIGLIADPANPATTGLRFVSSLNTGPSATAVINSTDYFPLGAQLIGVQPQTVAANQQLPITNAFSTIVGHTYSVDWHSIETVSGQPNATDRMAYVVNGNVIETHMLSELSTLQAAQPNGRMCHGVFTASLNAAVITANSGATNSVNFSAVPQTTGLNGMLLRDLGPTNLIIAP